MSVGTAEANRRKDHFDRLYRSTLDAGSLLCGGRAFEAVQEDENSLLREPYPSTLCSLKVHGVSLQVCFFPGMPPIWVLYYKHSKTSLKGHLLR